MLVSISGSQGSGKSTLISGLQNLGYKVIERKTARSILTDWDVTLPEVFSDPHLTMDYQDELLTRKYMDEYDAMQSDDIYITERTYADLFCYALAYLGPRNTCNEWLDNYFERCKTHCEDSYELVVYLQAGLFNVEHDGVRSTNQHFSRMMDHMMYDVTGRMVDPLKRLPIDEPNLDTRVTTVDSAIKGEGRSITRKLVLDPSTSNNNNKQSEGNS